MGGAIPAKCLERIAHPAITGKCQTLDYDALDALGDNASVIVDFAGNTQLVEYLHRQLAKKMTYSCMVGLSHWEDNHALPTDLPGPKPIMFFCAFPVAEANK